MKNPFARHTRETTPESGGQFENTGYLTEVQDYADVSGDLLGRMRAELSGVMPLDSTTRNDLHDRQMEVASRLVDGGILPSGYVQRVDLLNIERNALEAHIEDLQEQLRQQGDGI